MVGHGEIADRACARARRAAPTIGSMPGNARLLKVHRLKSIIVRDLRRVAAGIDVVGAQQEHVVAVHRACSSGSRGWTTKMPIMPIAICIISSACGWYMKVPLCLSANS